MQYEKFIILIQYCVYYYLDKLILESFVSSKPLVGHNIRPARENEFPFVVGILRRARTIDPQRDILCTGSLISLKDILSAQHCTEEESANGLTVIIGSIDIVSYLRYYPSWWITFDQWAANRNITNTHPKNDLTIMRLSSLVNTGIPPAKISYLSYREMVGNKVTAVGWGEINNGTFPRILHTTKLKIMNSSACEETIFALGGRYLHVDKNIFCSVAKPFAVLMCGDSGGPLLYENKIVAINLGTCPFIQQHFHPDKINIHIQMKYYKSYVNQIIDL